MKIAPIAEVKARLSEYIRQSTKESVIITKNGRPAAILVGITEEDDLENFVLAYNSKFRKMLLKSEKRIRQGKGVEHKAFWNSVEKEE